MRLRSVARASMIAIGVSAWIVPLVHHASEGAWRVLDWLFIPVCHRLPERTIALFGVLMPVCSRCAGVFAGLALGALIARPKLELATWRKVIAATAVLMIADVITQDAGVHPLWHPVRLATGAAFGYATAAALVAAAERVAA